ncbi:MAG: BamA/TamA family outer membrane protein [bacterium]
MNKYRLRINPIILIALLILLLPNIFSPDKAEARFKVRDYKFHWKKYSTEHFDIYYYEEENFLIDYTVSVVEDAYAQISRIIDYYPPIKFPVIIYKSHQEFEQTNIIDEPLSEGVAGFSEVFHKRVVVPYDGNIEQYTKTLIHEITHVFVFDMYFGSVGSIFSGALTYPADWFMEGFPEYIASDWTPEGVQVLRDAVLSNKLHNLKDLENFYNLPSWEVYQAYKEGHSAVEYLVDEYGLDKLTELIHQIKRSNNKDVKKAIEKTLEISLDEFNEDWQVYLKRKFFPQIETKQRLKEYGNRLSSYEEISEGTSYIASQFTPSGELIITLSNRGRFIDAYLIKAKDGKVIDNLTKGLSYSQFDYISPTGNPISISPDGNLLAFIARKGTRDRLYIFDIVFKKIVGEYKLAFDDISSPSFSPDGKYIALCGLQNESKDIFIFNLKTSEIKRITNTSGEANYPCWSYDGSKIAFSCETTTGEHIFIVDVKSGDIEQLTFGEWDDRSPVFSPDDKKILFTSDRNDSVMNLYIYDFEEKVSKQVSDLWVGVSNPTFSPDGEKIAFTGMEDGVYQICVKSLPLPETGNIYKETPPEVKEKYITLNTDKETLDNSKKYGINLVLDYATSSLEYTTGGAFRNYTQVAFSDMLGNHRFDVLFDLTSVSSLNDVDAGFSYYNLSHRTDLSFLIQSWRDYYGSSAPKYYWERLSGGQALFSYPLTTVNAFIVSPFFYHRKWEIYEEQKDTTVLVEEVSNILFGAQVSFVRDSRLWGYYNPTSGGYNAFMLEQTIPTGKNKKFLSYTNIIFDQRKYIYMSQRNSLALRLVCGTSFGKDPQKFFIGGGWTVRGYPYYSFYGTKFLFANVELRFPIIDAIYTGIPGFAIGGFRGVLFIDAGSAWSGHKVEWDRSDLGDKFRPWLKAGGFRLYHLKASIGFGLRWAIFNMFDLRLDWAFPTDLTSIQTPPYIHFSLGPSF